jgi:hypothetical protein
MLTIAHTQYEGINGPRWSGSVVGCQYIYCDRLSGTRRLFNNYFSKNLYRRFVISASNLVLI